MKRLQIGAAFFVFFAGGTMFSMSRIGQQEPAPGAKILAPRQHRPMSLHRMRENGTAESTNWSGYAVTGANGSVNYVSGSWVVPAVTCPAPTTSGRGRSTSPSTYSSFWVGIDGWTSSSVEQIGTDSDCSNGSPSYYAWYEFYPQPSYYAGTLTNLAAGDIVTATVTYNSNASFTLAINVQTSGLQPAGNFSITITPTKRTGTPVRSSAEWITEAPSNGGGQILSLSNFGIVGWGPDNTIGIGSDTATVGGSTEGLDWFNVNQPSNTFQTTMVGKSGGSYVPIAVPSSLSSTSSFTVARENPTVP